MKAQRTAKADSEKTTLERLIGRAVAARKIILGYEEEHEDVLQKYKHLQEDLVGIQELIKIEARKVSVLGQTKVIIDNRDIHISVQGKETRVFDLKAARKFWSPEAFAAATVVSVDGKIVESMVEAGKLTEDDKKKALIVTPATPAVTVRFP